MLAFRFAFAILESLKRNWGNKMTDKQYVLRAAKTMNVDVIAPTRGCPGIIATDWAAKGKSVIDAATWSEARAQLNAYQQQRASA